MSALALQRGVLITRINARVLCLGPIIGTTFTLSHLNSNTKSVAGIAHRKLLEDEMHSILSIILCSLQPFTLPDPLYHINPAS